VSMKWDHTPINQLTISYWMNIMDPHLTQQPVFAYSAYSVDGRYGAGGAPYENANEVVLLHAPTYLRLFRATSNKNIESNAVYDAAGTWQHNAIVWSADPAGATDGQFAHYVNGVLVGSETACAVDACDMGKAVQGGGVIHLGQEADKPWGDFEELQAFTGVLDELQVWTTARTPAEILADYNKGLANPTGTANLDFYWKFDDAGSTTATDAAGHSRDGMIGEMATTENQLQYSTGRASQVPVAPLQIPSTAPVITDGVPTITLVVDGDNFVTLGSMDPDGDDLVTKIAIAPTHGTLTAVDGSALVGNLVTDGTATSNKRVKYTPTNYATFVSDTFTYTVNDDSADGATTRLTGTVKLEKYSMPTVSDVTYSFNEDELSYMVLGKAYVSSASKQTSNMHVVITELPAKGTLYQACFEAGADGDYYTTICATGSTTSKTTISAANTALANARGIVMFQPATNEFDASGYATFKYRLQDPDDASITSNEATVTISISPVNDAPTGTAQSATVIAGETHVFTLAASDNDEDATSTTTYAPSFGPHPFAKVSMFPTGGKLSQVDASGAETTQLDSTVTDVPIVSAWVSEVVRFSSQFSKCNAGKCFIWSGAEDTGCQQSNVGATSTCDASIHGTCAVPYGEPITWGDSSCSEYAWQANQIIGAADFYPGYGDTALGYDLSAENSGKEFIELKFPSEVYVSGFELYETYKPGATYEISTAPQYTDDNTVACCGEDFPAGGNCDGRPVCSKDTAWKTIWSGAPGNTGEEAKIFAPDLCPYLYKTSIVRVDLDTDAASGWNNFDAAKLFGSLEQPPGLILPQASNGAGSENKIAYTALNGIHGTDTFHYQVTDCLGYGDASPISITLPAPSAAFASMPHVSFPAVLASGAATTTMPSDMSVAVEHGIFSLHQMLRGSKVGVAVTCVGLKGLTKLSFGPVECTSEGQAGTMTEWSAAPIVVAEGEGHAEIWLQKSESSLVQRVQYHVCPKRHLAFLDTPGVGSADTCTDCMSADGKTLGPIDTATYASLCAAEVQAKKDADAEAEQQMMLIIIATLSAVVGLVLFFVGYKAVIFIKKAIRSHKEQQEQRRKRCRQAVASAVTLQSTCHLITLNDLKNMGILKPHEIGRDAGMLKSIDNYEDLIHFSNEHPIIFFSHQWLAWSHPDPDKTQYKEMIASVEELCRTKGFDPSSVYIFLDYMSIPQKNMRLRLCAIDALGVISSVAHYFIVIAPSATHKDTKKLCDKDAYSRRGWCRLEQWGHLSTMGMENMFFFKNGKLVDLDDTPEDGGEDWFLDSIMVFEGEFTNPDNKAEMVDVVLGLWAMAIKGKDGATKKLHAMIEKYFTRAFPPELFGELPTMLAEMMGSDTELKRTMSRSDIQRVLPKGKSAA